MRIRFYILFFYLILVSIFVTSCNDDEPKKTVITPTTGNIIAFPGAEGGGSYVTGGRNGQVYYVTTLEDHADFGSLRYGLLSLSGPRIILFKVSGTIVLNSELIITKGDVTVAGQSAPGDGICLRNYPVTIKASNVIFRFMRFRMGDVNAVQGDALGAQKVSRIMIDHCSISWSTDECASFYENEDFTLQWCIISESLRVSVHDKGSHGYGGIWGGKNASFHHNLLAHHDSRNPRFDHPNIYTNLSKRGNVDFCNNVVYNWQGNSTYGGEAGNFNMINNYYKKGPATSSSRLYFIQPYKKNPDVDHIDGYGKFYISGNYFYGDATKSSDNWSAVQLQYTSDSKLPLQLSSPLLVTSLLHLESAESAYLNVLSMAGASLSRDAVDLRIINEVTTGTVTYTSGGHPVTPSVNGIIDTQTAVGGWPTLNSTTAPTDTDLDGMPDTWEDANGLNKTLASDGKTKTIDPNAQLTNLEMYLNSLVSHLYSTY